MGTRNLTMVISQEGEKKVAQYGQWDGYPSGVGLKVLAFCSDKELFEKFKNKLSTVRFLDQEGKDKDFIESYNKNAPEWSNQPDLRTEDQKLWFETFITRNLAASVLHNIANSDLAEIVLFDDEGSAKGNDSWVEWSYVINLKENKLFVHDLIDRQPIKIYDLENIPTEEQFLKDLEGSEEE